ncbi:MAG TPA: D-alanyl-D-alanine carboxypeptidase, partial [Mollicutes bacterium]|nr:D-alanyl-D-alanine carboxypeptidase [Mollicutes bacterium]
MGVSDSKVRNVEISEMLNFAFAQYETEQLLSKNSILGTVEIEKGTKKYVNVIPLDKVTILNKKGNQKKTATYELELGKIKAPIKNGDVIGELIIKENDQVTRRIGV